MKRVALMLLCLLLALSSAAFAEDQAPDIAGQYYAYSFSAEGYGDFNFYFHFYEADPVLGAVYYAGLSNNRVNFAGLYSVEEAPYEYACYPDREMAVADESEKVLSTGTAPYTIHFMDWDGNEIDTCGWDGEVLYNDCETIVGSGSGPMFYPLDSEGKYQAAYDEEVGIPYLDFVAVDDPTSTVSLCHNMTYTDMMMYFIDGSWKLSYDEAGNAVYDFTPFDETEDPAVLVVTPDQKTAVYTDGMGDAYDMVNMATEGPEALYAGEGVMTVEAYGADATIALTLFDDDTCELSASIFGNSSVLDSGVYTVNADHSISFVFDNAGELTASLDTEVMGVVLEYSNEETALGAVQVSLPIVRAAQDASASALLFAFTGTYTTFEVYDDNSYVFSYEGAGLSETGAWAFENYQFTLTQANGNVITAAMDDAKNLTFEYVAEASDQLKDTFTCESAVWGPALVQ